MDIPNTAASASAFSQSQWAGQVGSAVAVKVLDAQRQAGAGVLRLLAAAAGPSTASLNGLGHHVDVVG